jgi:hypothetical protein
MTDDHDPVAHGIKEWDKVRKAAEAAIEEAKKSKADAEYFRGQCELMIEQRRRDEEHMRGLQQHCDEMILMIDALGASVIAILEKRKAGFFRRAGSIAGGADRLRTASTLSPADIEADLAALAAAHPANAAATNGHKR